MPGTPGGLTSPQSPIPSLPSSASPLGADTYFITAKFVFECKTKRGEATQGVAALLRPDICATQWFPQKRNQFNKIMENVKMLTGGDFDGRRSSASISIRVLDGRSIGPLGCPGPIMRSQTSGRPPSYTVREPVSDTSMLMEPIFHQVIRIMGTCFVFRHCAST